MANSAIVGTLKAVLSADTAEFTRAMSNASAEVKELANKLQKDLEPRQRAVNAAVKDFLGGNEIRRAQEYALAIDKIGDVALLTAADQLKVNKAVNEALDHYKALGQQAPANLLALRDATAGVQKPTESLNVSFGKLVASFVTAQAIIGAVKAGFGLVKDAITESITAAGDAEKAHAQLVAALRAQGTAVPSVIAAYDGYANALQKTTVFQDDALEGAAALLVQIGDVMPRDMQKALEATTNLASGLGIDLESATRLVAKAAEGNTGALQKVGVVLDETKGKTHSFGEVLDAITEKFGGQAAAVAGTYQGRIKQLENTWNDVQESIGRAITQNETLLTAIGDVTRELDANTGELKDNQTLTNLVSDAVLISIRAFSTLATTLDVLQTGSSGFMITLRNMGAALGNIGILALEASKGVSFMSGNIPAIQDANAMIKALEEAVGELESRNVSTTERSVALGNALTEISARADHLSKALEVTRGRTVATRDATDTGTDAWTRHTTALNAGAEETKKQAAALKNLESGLSDLTEQQYEQIAALLAAGKAEGDIAKAYGFTAQQVKEVGIAEREHLELSKKLAAANDAIRKKNIDDAKARQQAADNLSATLADLTDAEIELITAQVRAGKSTKDIALVYGFTEEQIRLVIDAEKDLSAVLKKVEDDAKRHAKALQDGLTAISKMEMLIEDTSAKRTLKGTDLKIREIQRWAAAELATFKGTEQQKEEFFALTAEAMRQQILGIESQWVSSFDTAADGFQQLAQIAGDELGGIVRSVGTVTSALANIGKGAKQISQGGTGNVIAGAGLAITGFSMIQQVTDSFRSPEYLRIMRDVGERWGVEISGGVAKAIQASKGQIAEDVGGGAGPIGQRRADELLRQRPEFAENATKDALREVAELLHLAEVIQDAGGLTAANALEWETRARDLFDVVAIGGRTGAEATRELSDVVRLFADQATETGGLWSSAFQAIIADAKAAGIELEGLTDAINAQLDTAASATSKIVGGFVSTLPDLPEGERTEEDDEKIAAIVGNTQEQFDRVSRIALASFNAMVANGQSAAEAIAMIGPSIDELSKKAEEFGFAGSEAFNQLSRWRDLTTENQGLLDQVSGLNELMVALGNVGALDIATFQDLQDEGTEAFKQLTAAGFTQQEALKQMEPFLENIIELHDERGLAIDDETQALINQAKEHGLLKAKEISTNDILMQGLGKVIELLGGELPKAWRIFANEGKQAASDVQDELNKIKAPTLRIPVSYDVDQSGLPPSYGGGRAENPSEPNNPHAPGFDPGNPPPDMALGGYVPPRPGGTLVNVGEGGEGEWVIPKSLMAEAARLHDLMAEYLAPLTEAGKGEWVIPEDIMDAWTRQPVGDSGSMLAHAEQHEGGHSAIKVIAPAVTVDNKIYIDGREVAFSLAPHLPAAVRPYGVTRR